MNGRIFRSTKVFGNGFDVMALPSICLLANQSLKKTFPQIGESLTNLLELDLLRDSKHDFLTSDEVFAGLLRAAMGNRTRRVLRHRPVEGKRISQGLLGHGRV